MDTISTETIVRKKGKGGRIIAIVLVVLFAALFLFVYWRYYYTYSDGNRFGLLQKFSHRGAMFKTYEGELVQSSLRGNNNTSIASEKFYFSVTDDAVAQQLNNLQGRNVVVHYREKNSSAFWRGDSPYIVDSVRADQ